jgi:chromosome segregation ATPase
MLLRPLHIIFLLFTTLSLQGQTQQGYVKTIGRPNKPGVPLTNVTIRFRGLTNQVLTGKDGKFAVLLQGKKEGDAIVLQSVRKNGYELKDRELVGRSLVYSSRVPLEIVMINSVELEANKQRMEQQNYEKAEKRYQQKLKQLEKKVKEQEITAEQYRQQLQGLQDQFEKYQSLISDLADRYARTDYDHLDSIDREINICIEKGELEEADSLIHTVFDPETVLERNRAAKEAAKAKKQLGQDMIDEANDEKERLLHIQKTVKESKNE